MQFNIPAEFKNASGVYIIRNSVNAKVYVGSASNFQKRYQGHRSHLLRGKHSSKHLQNHCNKYGIESLTFNLLELTVESPGELLKVESRYIEAFDAANPVKGFNNMPASLPARHSEETKTKLRGLLAGYMTPEVLVKRNEAVLAAAQKKTEARMARRAICQFCGSEFMPKLKKSMAKAKFCSHECSTKYPVSEETRAKRRAKSQGRTHTPEAIEKIRRAQLGRPDPRSSEGKERQRLATSKRMLMQPEEQKAATIARLHSPEIVERRIASLKAKGPWNKSADTERQRTCQHCGKSFLVDWPKQVRLFCSRVCYCAGLSLSNNQRAGLEKRQAKRTNADAQPWYNAFVIAISCKSTLLADAAKLAGVSLVTVYRYKAIDADFAIIWQQARQ